ncbi:MAG: helix-turn-helix domain-containing protein [Parvularculaceae bacterium]|nr:helix-turn-helix domain-containing protein [Parvularculaceae bacterium]
MTPAPPPAALLVPQTLSVDAAARRLGVSAALVRKAIRDGRLPCRRFGRLLRVPLAAIEAWERGECDWSNIGENGRSESGGGATRPASTPSSAIVPLPNGRRARSLAP